MGDTTEGVESSEEEEDEVNHDELGDLESLVDHLLDQDQQARPLARSFPRARFTLQSF